MGFKIYEWGTLKHGQVEYEDKYEAFEAIEPYIDQPIGSLIPVVLAGYAVEGTAFFIAIEPEQGNDSQDEVNT